MNHAIKMCSMKLLQKRSKFLTTAFTQWFYKVV